MDTYATFLAELRAHAVKVAAAIAALEALGDGWLARELPETPDTRDTPDTPETAQALPPQTKPKKVQTVPPDIAKTRSERSAKVLDYLRAHPDASPTDIRNALRSSPPAIKQTLKELRAEGLVVAAGATLNRTSRLAGTLSAKPNGKVPHDDELEVVWSGGSKKPLTAVQG